VGSKPWRTDWPTFSRKVTLTLTLVQWLRMRNFNFVLYLMTLCLRIYIVGGDSKQPTAKGGKRSCRGRRYQPGISLQELKKSMELFAIPPYVFMTWGVITHRHRIIYLLLQGKILLIANRCDSALRYEFRYTSYCSASKACKRYQRKQQISSTNSFGQHKAQTNCAEGMKVTY
jgi:hypothetical protein